jgi:hypothetical protein
VTLAVCRKILEKTELSDGYFLRLHRCVEAVLKRLLFIGLRCRGLCRVPAETIAETCRCRAGFGGYPAEVFTLCGIDYGALTRFCSYAVLEDLFLNYSAPCRDRRVHGASPAYTDLETLGLLVDIDKAFVKELQFFLNQNGYPSLFDPPGKWGARRGNPKDDGAVYRELFGKEPKPPRPGYTREQAKAIFDKAARERLAWVVPLFSVR